MNEGEALADGEAANRADVLQDVQPEAAQRLHRRRARQQAAVEQIDGPYARGDVGASHAAIGFQHRWRADVAACGQRVGDAIGDAGGIAQAEVQTLRADGRDDVHRLADEGDAIASGGLGRLAPTTERRRAGRFRRPGRAAPAAAPRARRGRPSSSSPASSCATAGRSTQTRLDVRPGEGTTVNGPAGRWNSVEMPSCGRWCAKVQVTALCS